MITGHKPISYRCPIVLFAVVLAILLCLAGCASDAEKLAKHLKRAEALVAQQRYNEALIEYKNASQLDPENDNIHFQLGEIYLRLQNFESATRSFGQAINLNENNLAAHYKIGQIFLAADRPMDARRAAKFIIENAPDNIDAYLLLAGVQVKETNLSAAIQTLQQAVAINPGSIRVWLFLGQLFTQKKNFKEAENAYLQVISINAARPEPYTRLIRLYGQNGRWEQAAACATKMKAAKQLDVQVLIDLARFCEANQQWHLAETIYSKATTSTTGTDTLAYLELGNFYARRHLFDQALDTMKAALRVNSKDPDILANMGRMYLDVGDREAARDVIERALLQNFDHQLANYLQGEIYYLDREYAQAIKKFELSIQKDENNFRPYYYKALSVIRLGERGQSRADLSRAAAGLLDDAGAWVEKIAESDLLKAIELNPKLLQAKLVLAELYLRQQKIGQAREQIEAALKQRPGDLKVLSLEGSLKISQRNFKGAEALCKSVLAQNPNLSDWHARLGLVYRLMRRPDDARKAFERALALNPLQFEALQAIIDMHLQDRQFAQALDRCEAHKSKISNNNALAVIENMQGGIYGAWNKPQKARPYFEKAIAVNPDFITARMNLAWIEMLEDKYLQAVAQYETVLQINPRYLPAVMALGSLHASRKEKQLAVKYFRRALDIKIGYGPAANNLAFLLSSDANSLREALDLAQLAYKKIPDDPIVKDTLGWIYYQIGDYYKALPLLEASLKMNPDSALTNYHIGLTYYREKQFAKAREHLKRALELDPDFDEADDIRAMLDE